MIALYAKNKVGLVTGRIPKPSPESPMNGCWLRCKDMVFAQLSNSLSKDTAKSVLHHESAKDMWSDLKERYRQYNSI